MSFDAQFHLWASPLLIVCLAVGAHRGKDFTVLVQPGHGIVLHDKQQTSIRHLWVQVNPCNGRPLKREQCREEFGGRLLLASGVMQIGPVGCERPALRQT